jgi:putative salt-induced outer membrane protein
MHAAMRHLLKLLACVCIVPSIALADDAKVGFADAPKTPEPDKNTITDVSMQLGAMLAAGNSRSTAVTGAVKSKIRREHHQFTGAIALNYAQSGKTGEQDQTTVENLQGLLRYDYFFTDRLSIFLKVSGMRDRFQGLDARLNVDPGVAYYFVSEKTLKLWGEIGYDFSYDVRRDDAIAGTMLDKTVNNQGTRAFLGYDHKLGDQVQIVMGLEYLQPLTDTNAWRLNADASLKANLAKKFAVATSVQLRYDHGALPTKEETDVLTSVSLVYSLF